MKREFASGLPHSNRTDSFDFSSCVLEFSILAFGFRHRVLELIFPMFEIQIGNTEIQREYWVQEPEEFMEMPPTRKFGKIKNPKAA